MEMRYQLKKPKSLKSKKRVGRGVGSGVGKTCGRGQKGQLCRSGSKRRPWFEGGQMPIQRRVPKRGFTNKFKKSYQILNLSQLSKLNLKDIDQRVMKERGLIQKLSPVKILGEGEITKPVRVQADEFSRSAREKIEKAGGEVIIQQYSEKQEETQKEA